MPDIKYEYIDEMLRGRVRTELDWFDNPRYYYEHTTVSYLVPLIILITQRFVIDLMHDGFTRYDTSCIFSAFKDTITGTLREELVNKFPHAAANIDTALLYAI